MSTSPNYEWPYIAENDNLWLTEIEGLFDSIDEEVYANAATASAASVRAASHASRHQNGGADEISVADLSGLLADGQTPILHASTHEDGGSDEIDVTGLVGAGGGAHAVDHQSGGTDELSGPLFLDGGTVTVTGMVSATSADLRFLKPIANVEVTSMVSAVSSYFRKTLRTNRFLSIDDDGDQGVSYIYFRNKAESITWDQNNTWFALSDDVVTLGTFLWIGSTASGTKSLGFRNDGGTTLLRRVAGTPEYWELTGDLDLRFNGRNLYINSDYTSGDVDNIIYFNDQTCQLKWDHGANRFEFSEALYTAGGLNVNGSIDAVDVIRGRVLHAEEDIYVNKDYTSGDQDATIYFNDTNESFKWDYGNSQFELSDSLQVSGNLEITGSNINLAASSTIANSGAAGTRGDIRWDNDYAYVCVGTNKWGRAALDRTF